MPEILFLKTHPGNKTIGIIELKVMRRWKCDPIVYVHIMGGFIRVSHTNCNVLLIIQVFAAL